VLFAGTVERGFGEIIKQGVGLAIEYAVYGSGSLCFPQEF